MYIVENLAVFGWSDPEWEAFATKELAQIKINNVCGGNGTEPALDPNDYRIVPLAPPTALEIATHVAYKAMDHLLSIIQAVEDVPGIDGLLFDVTEARAFLAKQGVS